MDKCMLCNKKLKFSRKCPALNEMICSTCCGTKRNVEIKCTEDCKHFIEGQIKENKKQIERLVKESYNSEAEDIYQDDSILHLVMPFEKFVFESYYNDKKVTDEFISQCYTKIYYSLEQKNNIYDFDETELCIFNEFSRIAKETNIPIEVQKLILLRMMKSVDSMTGGMFGNRMYLELLRHHFTGTGLVTDVMSNTVNNLY